MPRKSETTKEIAPSSPLRRSSRISTTSSTRVDTPVATREITAPARRLTRSSSTSSEPPAEPVKVTKARRLSLSQDILEETKAIAKPASLRTSVLRRSVSKSPETLQKDKKSKLSVSEKASSLDKIEESSRRRSLRSGSKSPENKPAKKKIDDVISETIVEEDETVEENNEELNNKTDASLSTEKSDLSNSKGLKEIAVSKLVTLEKAKLKENSNEKIDVALKTENKMATSIPTSHSITPIEGTNNTITTLVNISPEGNKENMFMNLIPKVRVQRLSNEIRAPKPISNILTSPDLITFSPDQITSASELLTVPKPISNNPNTPNLITFSPDPLTLASELVQDSQEASESDIDENTQVIYNAMLKSTENELIDVEPTKDKKSATEQLTPQKKRLSLRKSVTPDSKNASNLVKLDAIAANAENIKNKTNKSTEEGTAEENAQNVSKSNSKISPDLQTGDIVSLTEESDEFEGANISSVRKSPRKSSTQKQLSTCANSKSAEVTKCKEQNDSSKSPLQSAGTEKQTNAPEIAEKSEDGKETPLRRSPRKSSAKSNVAQAKAKDSDIEELPESDDDDEEEEEEEQTVPEAANDNDLNASIGIKSKRQVAMTDGNAADKTASNSPKISPKKSPSKRPADSVDATKSPSKKPSSNGSSALAEQVPSSLNRNSDIEDMASFELKLPESDNSELEDKSAVEKKSGSSSGAAAAANHPKTPKTSPKKQPSPAKSAATTAGGGDDHVKSKNSSKFELSAQLDDKLDKLVKSYNDREKSHRHRGGGGGADKGCSPTYPSEMISSDSDNCDDDGGENIVEGDEEDDEEDVAKSFIDDLAEDGSDEESHVSIDSNEIVDEGESVGSSADSNVSVDGSYEEDSFVVDDESDDNQLLEGDEYDLGNENVSKQGKKSRIIQIEDSSDEDLDNMSTRPYMGFSPVCISEENSSNASVQLLEVLEQSAKEKTSVNKDFEVEETLSITEMVEDESSTTVNRSSIVTDLPRKSLSICLEEDVDLSAINNDDIKNLSQSLLLPVADMISKSIESAADSSAVCKMSLKMSLEYSNSKTDETSEDQPMVVEVNEKKRRRSTLDSTASKRLKSSEEQVVIEDEEEKEDFSWSTVSDSDDVNISETVTTKVKSSPSKKAAVPSIEITHYISPKSQGKTDKKSKQKKNQKTRSTVDDDDDLLEETTKAGKKAKSVDVITESLRQKWMTLPVSSADSPDSPDEETSVSKYDDSFTNHLLNTRKLRSSVDKSVGTQNDDDAAQEIKAKKGAASKSKAAKKKLKNTADTSEDDLAAEEAVPLKQNKKQKKKKGKKSSEESTKEETVADDENKSFADESARLSTTKPRHKRQRAVAANVVVSPRLCFSDSEDEQFLTAALEKKTVLKKRKVPVAGGENSAAKKIKYLSKGLLDELGEAGNSVEMPKKTEKSKKAATADLDKPTTLHGSNMSDMWKCEEFEQTMKKLPPFKKGGSKRLQPSCSGKTVTNIKNQLIEEGAKRMATSTLLAKKKKSTF